MPRLPASIEKFVQQPKTLSIDAPNMTDAHRIRKEANFNPYLLERIAKSLLKANVLVVNRQYNRTPPQVFPDRFASKRKPFAIRKRVASQSGQNLQAHLRELR